MQSEYQRDLMRRNKARADIDMNIAEEKAYRALPGQFNRRGMLIVASISVVVVS